MIAICPVELMAQGTPRVRSEHEVKALFFVTLARYTQWPTNAFESDTSPMILGVLGDHPILRYLPPLVNAEKIQGRSLEVRPFASVDELKNCHLLFFGNMGVLQREVAVSRLRSRAIMTVSDRLDFIEQGGMVETFVNRENKIRFNLSTNAISRAQLQISPSLIRIAERVAFIDPELIHFIPTISIRPDAPRREQPRAGERRSIAQIALAGNGGRAR